MRNNLQLFQAINTKICNDLTDSVNIINNCINALDEQNGLVRQQARKLLDEKSHDLVKRIQYFRECYGLSERKKKSTVQYFGKLLEDFSDDDNITQVLNFEDDSILVENQMIQVVFCLLAISREHMNPPGEIELLFGSEESNIRIITKGENLIQRKESLKILEQDVVQNIEISLENCREYYVKLLCRKSGYNLSVKKENNTLECYLTKI